MHKQQRFCPDGLKSEKSALHSGGGSFVIADP